MGAVYLAKDVALSRKVAIKVISPQLLADENMVARFRLEARSESGASRLQNWLGVVKRPIIRGYSPTRTRRVG